MVVRSVLNGFKKYFGREKERLFLPFAYVQTTVCVRANNCLRMPKWPHPLSPLPRSALPPPRGYLFASPYSRGYTPACGQTPPRGFYFIFSRNPEGVFRIQAGMKSL